MTDFHEVALDSKSFLSGRPLGDEELRDLQHECHRAAAEAERLMENALEHLRTALRSNPDDESAIALQVELARTAARSRLDHNLSAAALRLEWLRRVLRRTCEADTTTSAPLPTEISE